MFALYNIKVHHPCTEGKWYSGVVPEPSCEPQSLHQKVLQNPGGLTQECTDRWRQKQASLKQATETESRTCL